MEEWSCKRRIQQYLIIMVISWKTVSGQIRYSIPEEMQKGSFVGNIAKDLGVNGKQLSDHGLRIVTSKGMTQYFGLNVNNGHLQISERIDREKICGEAEKCMLKFQVLVENKLKLYSVEVEITDINDNSPQFLSKEWKIEIPETATPTDRFTLPKARDPDLGINSIQNYELTGSNHFSLEIQRGENGARQAELVLDQPLDREEQPIYNLILTAADGGNPIKSAMIEIYIVILDTNDNGPLFSQSIYEVTVKENIPKWSTVATVRATDLDEGINGEVKYFFEDITKRISQMFLLNSTTGEIILVRNLDYEESSWYEFEVQAMDGGGLRNRSKVLVYVMDINDNPPDLVITFSITYVAENTPTGTTVAILNAQDRDSGVNGQVMCSIPSNLPFKLKKMQDDFYTLVTEKSLDREEVAVYNITITAVDEGTPALSTSEIMSLKVLDINDNPPIFVKSSYTSYLLENNPRGASVFCLKANDADWEENGRITYYVIESQIRESLLSSYLSINSETGVVYALNSFDYEEIQEIKFLVKAQDGGSPPLSSNVSVTLFILDENDNAPVILYPSLPTDGSTGIEMAPRSSEPDYLVTKVVAVDADSGQNAWLSYQLTKATEPGLFTLGLHTGEIRTSRFLLDKDALKQSLVVLVKDNGQPPLSASVTVTVVLADSIPEMLSDLSSISAPIDPPSDLTSYLVIAVAFISCLFLTFLLVLLAIKLHRWRISQLLEPGNINYAGAPVSQFVGIDGVRAFLQSYCHEVSMTAGSRKSQCNHFNGNYSDTMSNEQTCGGKDPILSGEDLNLINSDSVEVQQAQPNTDWRFSQAQRPGTSGSQNGEENGTWPNNQFDTEMLQAMILASANEAAAAAAANPDGNSTLGGGAVAGTMGLSTRYGPQFTLQHVPDYRQNVYIPGSTATLSNAAGKRDGKPAASGGGNKKKSGKKEKK
ncbi:protocadherin gamma-A6 isoform X32 [Anolis carolinensis]|uniref:Protocadherin gamma a9 isoform n=1 Tax=Anolis carolinensis TaxID=28377 RepID=D0IQ67_ANOCA|nr:TPA_inf: protocadherin gamma a9 isoform [Anolis carolinensis]